MKALLSLTFSILALSVFAQAPVNDDCSGIIDVGIVPFCSAPAQYTNAGATASAIDIPANNIPACFNNGVERDVWFQFELPADGSIVNVVISVYGNVGGNGTLQMPQVAIYRGDCSFGNLAELDCAAAPLNVNEVHKQMFSLTPGIPYFLRINDYSATAASNAGTFKLCIEKYVPEINIGTVASTQSCNGTLYDSGGPAGDYMSNEDLIFSICPTDFHQCITFNVENYNVEQGFDFIQFYAGPDATAIQITQLTGSGQNFQVQIPSNCAAVRFTSDVQVNDAGFKITWNCSPDACTTPPPTTCANPSPIAGLPFNQTGLSNCFSGNSINGGPCNDDTYLSGNDYVFAYTSPGDQCIKIKTTGTINGAGIGIYDQCPSSPGASCIGNSGSDFGTPDPLIASAFLEHPGTYYIVFGAGDNCSPFNITVDTVTCPVVLPNASTCDKALNIGGCSNKAPEIIALTPGAGDPNFIQQGVNQGCFVNPQFNYTFFYFKAAADGKFGFIVQSADPNEASDIDINVWGPIDTQQDICNYVSTKQPARSTWAGTNLPTGLADVNPETGSPELDDYDCGSPATPNAGGDRYVRRLDVVKDKYYVVMMDDYGNAIHHGGISADFSGTQDGVLHLADNITVSKDTAVCQGAPVQLNATGGVAYFWTPTTGLSCINCENPIATPAHTTNYQVQVAATCNTVPLHVNVQVANLNLGPDITVCNGASFTLNPNPDPVPGAVYNWTGNAGLSCYDCPSPVVSGLPTGIYKYIVILTTPQCVKSDTIKVTVLNGQQPQYTIAKDTSICAGQPVGLGGVPFPNTTYSWTSTPVGFTSAISNPVASPTATTKYYLTATSSSCPVSALDSVTVKVYNAPVITLVSDTAVCNGQAVTLGTTVKEPGVQYIWTPNLNITSDTIPNPVATPQTTTVYTLKATNPGCSVSKSVTIAVVQLDLNLSVPDTVLLCAGKSLHIVATVNPPSANVNWTPISFLQLNANGQDVIAKPDSNITYTAKVSLPGCSRTKKVYVQVDSLPWNLKITPADTTVCQGSKVFLLSPTYEPADFHHIKFKWIPSSGFLTPDSLFNAVLIANDSAVYYRININGGCIDTSKSIVNVIKPPKMFITPEDSTICIGGSVQLHLHNFVGVTDLAWSPDIAGCMGCPDPTVTPQTTTSYQVTGKYKGCPTGANAKVEVISPPTYNFPSDTKLCLGESIILNTAVIPNATYHWISTDPNFTPVNTPNPTVTPAHPGTFVYTVTGNLFGCSSVGQVTVTVDSASLSVKGDTSICAGQTVMIHATGSSQGTYNWVSNPGGASYQGANIMVTPGETTTYTVTYTFGDNCQISDNVKVTVQTQGPAFTVPTDLKLCKGESIVLNLSPGTPGATYTWSSNPTSTIPSIAQPVVTPGVGGTTFTLAASLGLCHKDTSFNVQVDTASLKISPAGPICAGESAQLVANGTVTGTSTHPYTWTSNVFTSPMYGATVSTGILTQSTKFTVLFEYGDGCLLKDSVTVKVNQNFTLKIVAKPDTTQIYLGDKVDLTAIPTPNLAGYTYVWQENSSGQLGTTDKITVSPTSIRDSCDNVQYDVIATSPAGCVQKETINLEVCQPQVRFPNAFTPNSDGLNDGFGMLILGGNAKVEQMDIYDRWGKKIYTSTEPKATWNGMVDGKEAPSDVYVYVIRWRKGDGALQVKSGNVTLLR